MNYYEHHIGDYAAATGHLSLVEDAIYSRLLRRYYLQEQPLPADVAQVARLCGARAADEAAAVEVVLQEFFELQADGWHNKRADEEIARYQAKVEAARQNGKRGGRPAKTQHESEQEPRETQPFSLASETETQVKALQTPDTSNQEDQKLSSSAAPSDAAGDELAQRLAQVTREALTAYNASTLTKRHGGNLPNVSETVGREKRQQQVRRCLRVAREICRESTGTPLVTPEFWAAYFDLVAQDDFYSGRVRGGAGHENFVPDFETLTAEKTMLRLYDRQVAA